MPTTKSKEKKVLLCARPDETVEFEFNGGIFDIGILPRRLYLKYMALVTRASDSLEITRLPDEDDKSFQARAGAEAMKKIMSPEFLDEFVDLQEEIVRVGVKGHKNLIFDDQTPIPFGTKVAIEAGREIQVVDDNTMLVYDGVKSTPAICDFMIERARGGDDPKAKRQRKK